MKEFNEFTDGNNAVGVLERLWGGDWEIDYIKDDRLYEAIRRRRISSMEDQAGLEVSVLGVDCDVLAGKLLAQQDLERRLGSS